tara:strand:- start:233 stop:493 length:261 start_codon:yes stop_codon:yes gene_type:complete
MTNNRSSTSDLSCECSIARADAIGAKRNSPFKRPNIRFLSSNLELFGKPTTTNSAASHHIETRYKAGLRIRGLIANRKAQDNKTVI